MKHYFLSLLLITSCFFSAWAHSGPVAGKSWQLPLPDDKSIAMNWINPGTFVMGSPNNEKGRKPDESPPTTVTLTKGYWLAETEVTIGEWEAVTGETLRDKVNKLLNDETLYDFDGKKMKERDFMHFDKDSIDKIIANEDDNVPMYFVSWNEAMAFCRKLTAIERAAGRLPAGYEYTLPTEAQWEYACRAGTTGATYEEATASDSGMDKIAWYGKNSYEGYSGRGFGNPKAGPRQVRAKMPNKWGMWDISGNIWEWCRDWYGPYPGGNVTDPPGPATGTYKVNRGGSFGSGLYDERSANRAKNPPNEDSAYRGFRLALCPVQ
jgi:formylglycine-generating enzyme required for sulfatase activity